MTDPYLDLESARWARARDDYRAGLSAAEVCGRHGLARSTFHARAHAERWRRCDLAPSAKPGAPPEADDFDPAAARRPAVEMADLAHRRLSHAVDKGRLREALGWQRLARGLRELAVEEENWSWRKLHREAMAAAAAAAAAERPAVDAAPPEPMSSSVKAATTVLESFTTLERGPSEQTQDALSPSHGAGAGDRRAEPGEAERATQAEEPPLPPSLGLASRRLPRSAGEGEEAASNAALPDRPSPAHPLGQALERPEKPLLALDSPDTFSAFNAVLPPELFAELLQDMSALRSGDPAHADEWAAWEAMRRKLKAARPDLSWWEATGEENGEEEGAEFVFEEDDLPIRGDASHPPPAPPCPSASPPGCDPRPFTITRDPSPPACGQAPIPLECAAARATLAVEP